MQKYCSPKGESGSPTAAAQPAMARKTPSLEIPIRTSMTCEQRMERLEHNTRSREDLSVFNDSELVNLLDLKPYGDRWIYRTSTGMSKLLVEEGNIIRLFFMGELILAIEFDRETKEAVFLRPYRTQLILVALTLEDDIPGRAQLLRFFEGAYNPNEFTGYAQHKDELLKILHLQSTYEGDSALSEVQLGTWGTTDPISFDPNKPFRFVVHGIRGYSQKTLPPAFFYHHEKESSLSCSVIDQSHLGTWAPAGFILEVPGKDILYDSPKDIGPYFDALGPEATIALMEGKRVGGLTYTARSLLRSTITHNEIIVRLDAGVKIVGGFVKVDVNDRPITPITWRQQEPLVKKIAPSIEQVCKENGLPVIYIRNFWLNGPELAQA